MKFSKIKLQMVQEQNFNYNSRTISSAIDIVKTINEYEELEKATEENIILICMNNKNQILAYSQVAKGATNYCNLDVKTIFKTILLCNGSKFILVHNHPTGDVTPSKVDREETERIKKMSSLMDIQFLDHIIVGNNGYTSCM